MGEHANPGQLYARPDTVYFVAQRTITARIKTRNKTGGATIGKGKAGGATRVRRISIPHVIVVGGETNGRGDQQVVVMMAPLSDTSNLRRWQGKPAKVTWAGQGRQRSARIFFPNKNPLLRCDLWLPTQPNPDNPATHNRAVLEQIIDPDQLARLGLGDLAIQQCFPGSLNKLLESIPAPVDASLNGHKPTP